MKPDANVARRFLLVGATILPLGLAISATGGAMVGSLLAIVGVALLISGLHTFGRAGPDTGSTPGPSSVSPPAEPSPPSTESAP
jgi:hypothetical protein